ncbi:MAG: hypothetical protein J6A28_01785 [Clostridia bacterium]|nr:hypothetical protein [Clostridia bacterium]
MTLESRAFNEFKCMVKIAEGYIIDEYDIKKYLDWRQSLQNQIEKLKKQNRFRPFNPIIGENPIYLDFILTFMVQKQYCQITKQQFKQEVIDKMLHIFERISPVMLKIAEIEHLMGRANQKEFKRLKVKQDLLWQKICKPFGGLDRTIKQDENDSVQLF